MRLGRNDAAYLSPDGERVSVEAFKRQVGHGQSAAKHDAERRRRRAGKVARLCAKYGKTVAAVRSTMKRRGLNFRQALRYKPQRRGGRYTPWGRDNMVVGARPEPASVHATAARRQKWRLDLVGGE